MNRAGCIGIWLLLAGYSTALAQSTQLSAIQNSPLVFAAADLTTNGVIGLTNTVPDLMVSSVSPVSAHNGGVSLVNTQAWVRRFNYNGYSYAVASKVIVDKEQNVIVTGWSSKPATSDDFLTIKYARDGTPLWTNRWDGPAHLHDSAGYLAVDVAGNVYVAGRSEVSSATWDVVTIKYSADGQLLWASHYNRDGTNYCGPGGLAVDAAGNVLITASLAYATTAYITVKYDPLGNAVWTNYYKGSASGSDWAAALAVDHAGNIFVTGDSDGDGTGMNYATLKYAPDGTAVWTNRYINGFTAIPTAITVDKDGNAIVTGDVLWASHSYVTVKYSSNGMPLWTNLIPAADYQGGNVPRVVADFAGNVFLTGGSPGADGANADFTTVKLLASGMPLWTNSFFEVNSNNAAPAGTAVDAAGNFYFAGHATGPGGTNYNFVTIKYAGAGGAVWTNRYGGIAPGTWNVAEDLALDHAGNVVVVGGSGPSWSLSDFATVKYSDYVCYTPPTNFIGTDSFTFIAVDPFGNRATNLVNVLVLPANLQFNTGRAALWNNAAGMHLQVEGARGTNAVIIYASADLVDWEPVFTNQPAQGSVQFTDPAATDMPQRFYRAIQPQ
ncbi:MAG TPA: SBBP repeat-containing protein [Verrucomicrobiae bacterium]|nr:SBBP repeat-containing protein [Verrucomicrobiae bacterium]